MGSTMRPVMTACCLKTPPSFLTASQRDDTSSSSVKCFSFQLCMLRVTVHQTVFSNTLIFVSIFCSLSRCFHTTRCCFKARTGALEPSELAAFKKQAECLKFLPEFHFVGTGLASLLL